MQSKREISDTKVGIPRMDKISGGKVIGKIDGRLVILDKRKTNLALKLENIKVLIENNFCSSKYSK